jgi:hypothetical protein
VSELRLASQFVGDAIHPIFGTELAGSTREQVRSVLADLP